MLIAAIAVLVGVFFAATGRGGELSYERADSAPLDLGPVSAADVALLRPPTVLWGYNVQVTDDALDVIARAMRDRDVTIAYLQQQLADTNPEAARTRVVPRPAPATPVPPDLQALYGTRPSEAGQSWSSAGQDIAGREVPTEEEDLLPWDRPAVREDPAAGEELPAGQHPGYRDDAGAPEGDAGAPERSAGQEGPPENAGE
jgi:hypothetical protein